MSKIMPFSKDNTGIKLSQLTLLQTQKPARSSNEIVAKAEDARDQMAAVAKRLESILQHMRAG